VVLWRAWWMLRHQTPTVGEKIQAAIRNRSRIVTKRSLANGHLGRGSGTGCGPVLSRCLSLTKDPWEFRCVGPINATVEAVSIAQVAGNVEAA